MMIVWVAITLFNQLYVLARGTTVYGVSGGAQNDFMACEGSRLSAIAFSAFAFSGFRGGCRRFFRDAFLFRCGRFLCFRRFFRLSICQPFSSDIVGVLISGIALWCFPVRGIIPVRAAVFWERNPFFLCFVYLRKLRLFSRTCFSLSHAFFPQYSAITGIFFCFIHSDQPQG